MVTRKLQKYLRSDGRSVPRPFEKWLWEVFVEKSWKNRNPHQQWYDTVRAIASEWRCDFKVDPRWHWRESVYVFDHDGKGPHVLVGGAGNQKYTCTAALHELGHHILSVRGQGRADMVANEEAAWEVACNLAAQHGLPLVSSIKRQALYSYRYAVITEESSGSKTKTKRPKQTTVDRIAGSKRSARAGRTLQERPIGKKGKRKFKKETKERTARHERRRGNQNLE